MAKETKIGLAVVGTLLVVFSGLLVYRLSGSEAAMALEDEAVARFPQQPASTGMTPPGATHAPAHPPASIVVQQQPAEIPTEPAGIPDADQLPTHAPAAPTVAAEEPAADHGANPFHGRATTPDAEPATEPTPAPRVLAGEADTATQTNPRPTARTPRNPLRRTSAEEPVEDAGPAELAAPDDRYGQAPPAEIEETPPAEPAFTAPAEEPAAEPEPAPEGRYPRQQRWQTEDEPQQPAEPQQAEPAGVDGKYTIAPNDNLWIISEKVYGNGRYFKAIYEHNKSRLPQADRLTVGSVLDVPPADELERRYPNLCPKQRRSAVVKAKATEPVPARRNIDGRDIYIVAEGDTLFDIARYELGKASRWGEIYELNREALGTDFDYLQPGTELRMPPKTAADSVARRRGTTRTR